jgi:hypothetical protein
MTGKWREWFGWFWGAGTEKGSYAAPSECAKTKGAESLGEWKPKPPKTYDPRFRDLGGF